MKKSLSTLIKYSCVGLLLLLSTLIWGQGKGEDNIKYLTAKEPTKIVKGNQKIDLSSLKVRPEAKAVLNKMVQQKKAMHPPIKDELGKVFGQNPVPFQNFLQRNEQQKDLLISRDKHNVPTFIKGKNNQTLMASSASTSRSKDQFPLALHFLKEYKDILQIKNPSAEFKELTTIPDKQGNTHIKLQQYWNDFPIWNSQVIVHFNSKGVYAFNGRYHASPDLPAATATITRKEAAIIVKKVVGKEKFKFPVHLKGLSPNIEENLPELLYYFDEKNNQMQLAWKVEYHTKDHKDWLFMIDAQNGEILKKVNQACHLDAAPSTAPAPVAAPPTTARATDLHGVTQTINTFFDSESSLYALIDVSRPMFNRQTGTGAIFTYDLQFSDSDSLQNARLPLSRTNTWTNPAAVSAHHHAGMCYEYFYKTHRRNSIDGNGGRIVSYINENSPDNASWSRSEQVMFYGYGNNRFKQGSTAKSLDVSGHEMTHGVVNNSANFNRGGQQGSLNESFADIFGVMIDRDDWTLGEDIVNREVFPAGNLRNLANPSNNQPEDQPNWQPSHMDDYREEGGIHLNAGIPNHAFFLFATTRGVEKDKAEQVYYKALTQYLLPGSDFIDCRKAVIMAAEELYPRNPSIARAAAAAFDAVGILDDTEPESDLPTVSGAQYVLTRATYQGKSIMAEINLQDGSYYLKSHKAFKPRMSIEGTGETAIFVGTDEQVYITDLTNGDPLTNTSQFFTDPTANLEWRKIAVSKDRTKIAALTKNFDSSILFYDSTTDTFEEFEITHTDGVVEYLDMIQFDPTGEYIIYDAYNKRNSGKNGWDIGMINVWNNSTRRLGTGRVWKPFVNISDGYSLGNPIFSNTSNNLIAFEQIAHDEGTATTYVYDINTYDFAVITNNEFYSDYSLMAMPCFAPNDDYVAYTTDKDSDNNYITFQRFNKNTVATIGESQAGFTGEHPMWYAREGNGFNEEATPVASARAAPETTSLLTSPIATVHSAATSSYSQNLEIIPNPVMSTARVQYELTIPTTVTLNLYDLTGKKIQSILNQVPTEIGQHQQSLDVSQLYAGAYIIVLQTAFEVTTQKVVVK